ncbi:MAG: aspartate--tRNA(Asn) ligase [Nanoarchaeota archaeon]|nr:aspartate--tRNA(Asn) ligase [Nanoarchaeota archaeon]
MERTKINQLKDNVGNKVLLKGWVHETRDQSKVKFILFRDNSGIVQLVVKEGDLFNNFSDITKESVLIIEGEVKEAQVNNPEVSANAVEVIVSSYEVLSVANKELPIQVVKGKDQADLSVRLDWRWIDLRKPDNLLRFKIWTFMEKAMREFWYKEEFLQIYSPKLMGAPSESGAELFEVEYFGQKAYLAQSPQFFKQMAMASGFEKIFEIGPVFRANPSHTTRHDTEFTMIDMEISFIESHEDVMQVEEKWITHVISRIKEEYGEEIKKVFDADVVVPKLPFPRVTMAEAVKMLKEEKNYTPSEEGDLDAEGEKLLCELIKEKHGHEFVFVTEYPWSVRPFYHMKKEGTKDLTKSYDLLWKGLEITTGAQREHRLDILKEQAVEKGLDLDLIKDYLNFFKFGCPPHGGFGFSPTRMLLLLLNLKNVREVTFLPRDTGRLNP